MRWRRRGVPADPPRIVSMSGFPKHSVVADPTPGDIVDGPTLCPHLNCRHPMKLHGVGLSGSVYHCDNCGARL